MGSSKTPQTYSPGEAAQAAMGTAAAGEMMSVANQPIDQYGNLINMMAMGPYSMQVQGSLAGRAAKQAAQQQMDIQSSVDPQAYASRQMRMNAANQRLGRLYGVDPTGYKYNTPSNTYSIPGSADLPDPIALARNAQSLSKMLSIGAVNKAGANPVISPPSAKAMTGAMPYAIQPNTTYM
jgi:hypothetical protein